MTRRTLFPRWSAIALIAVAVLASSAAFGVPASPDLHAAVASFASPGERSVGRVSHEPSEQRGTVRTAILRANATVLSSPPAPGGTGPSGTRGIAALGAASARLALAVPPVPRERIDVRRDGVPSVAQPTPPSRAPPLA